MTVPDAVRDRLAPRLPADRYSWLYTAGVVLVGAVLRVVGLAHPRGKIFDETYYATEAEGLLRHGVEWNPGTSDARFVVHPPLGKWLIALGELTFGDNEFGWRISSAVAGTVSILLVIRLTRRLFRSTALGCAAGLLVSLDGMHLVLSRTALLDIFLMLFILGSFGCLVMDRDQRRRRWLVALEQGSEPRLGVPGWRLAAGVLIGCGCAVKWSAIWYLPLFAAFVIVWEAGARRSAGMAHPWRDTVRSETGWIVAAGALAAAAYLVSWTGWFVTDVGPYRHWLASQGRSEPPIIGPLTNLFAYHRAAYDFHTTLTTRHTYQSWPWQWLLLGRPVNFYWSGDGPCGSPQCASQVLLLGTPLLWWSFLPALAGLTWLGMARRDWRAAAIGLCAATGILPWFQWELADRTMYYFYALPAEPFLVMAVVYGLAALLGPAPARNATVPDRRLVGAVVVGVYFASVALCFAYFYPLYTGQVITYADWWARMWLGSRWV